MAIKHMRAIDAAGGDWPWRPHFTAVWRRFHDRPDELTARVQAVLSNSAAALEVEQPNLDEDFVEGRTYYALHRRRERDPKAVKLKKALAPPICEACGFEFATVYGPIGGTYIECHHTNPLAVTGETTTNVADLALVCANCHRMLHRGTDPPTVDELRALIAQAAA